MILTMNFSHRIFARLFCLAGVAVLAGCAHPVSIRSDVTYPKTQTANDASVGYYISDSNRKLEVTTPGGGGDKIRYFPYRDLEPALLETLGSVFGKVYALPDAGRADYIKAHDITFVFEPMFTTGSSSDSMMFWPVTDFDLTMKVTAVDGNGKSIWEHQFTGHGHVDKNRSLVDVPPAKEAAKQVFEQLRQALVNEPSFQHSSAVGQN
jgi:hypothetical protein